MTAAPPLLEVRGLSRTFPGLRALDDVSLDVRAGEVVALVGQNGSGKSTLVKVLTGVHAADPGGEVRVRGERVAGAVGAHDLHVIHQDLGLVGGLSTIENLDLGRRLGRRDCLPPARRAERAHARELVARFASELDVDAPVASLTPAERTIVAIARALDGWERPDCVLVLDEPTAALHGDEVGVLFAALRRVAASGAGIVYISHRLDEVLELADRVVALRGGRVVADEPRAGVDHDALVQMIAGRAVGALGERPARPGDDVVLRARDVRGLRLQGIDLELRRGEVLGVTGLLGSGREQLGAVLFGALVREHGDVEVAGRALAPGDPRRAIALGLAYAPADRRGQAAVMTMNGRENLTLPRLEGIRRRFGRIDRRAERREAEDWVGRIDLHPPEPERPLDQLSGGNQQKVVLAKWLRTRPAALILDEPTQGVDVGAKRGVHELIGVAAQEGCGVLVSSSDTKELAELCDRVLVLRDGRVCSEVPRAELSEARLVRESLAGSGALAGVA